MNVTLIFPITSEEGSYLEEVAHFAARRARTMKSHNELWAEVREKGAVVDQRARFLHYILKEEWSLDVAEMNIFLWDIEGVPSWLLIEFLRRRLIARDWSFEQRSKRAIHGERIPVINPFDQHKEYGLWYQMNDLIARSQAIMAEAHSQRIPAQRLRYAALEGSETSFVAGANARALHHLFTMRGSEQIGGNGTAAPEFMDVVDQMYEQAQAMCPVLFNEVLRS